MCGSDDTAQLPDSERADALGYADTEVFEIRELIIVFLKWFTLDSARTFEKRLEYTCAGRTTLHNFRILSVLMCSVTWIRKYAS
ncbi:hypothetical protein NDU88_000578 [Pleurodeles waltl]|uniref:Uncharacterized protein n=1 Tax=Pleurodeles waltl TaxID=8319 RepID=A0AAV7S866_PLEWA|nr:hypothetical protein NDU88_000578 [Pleurodeles waltl]